MRRHRSTSRAGPVARRTVARVRGDGVQYRDSGRGESTPEPTTRSMLTVFQCATLAGWAQVMYRVMDAGAETAVPYFVLLVLFGPYFVVNLFLAVLKTKFGKAQSLFRGKSWWGR